MSNTERFKALFNSISRVFLSLSSVSCQVAAIKTSDLKEKVSLISLLERAVFPSGKLTSPFRTRVHETLFRVMKIV